MLQTIIRSLVLGSLLTGLSPLATAAHTGEPEEAHTRTEQQVEKPKAELRQKAQQQRQKLQDTRRKVKEGVEAAKLKRCERRQKAVDNRGGKIQTATSKHSRTLDTTFEKIQHFVNSQKVEVANYQVLIANVNNAKAAATLATAALADSAPVLDCHKDDNTADVGVFGQNVKAAVQTLKDYRGSLHELVKAVKAAKSGGEKQP